MPEKQKQSVYTKDVVLVMAASFFFMFSTMIVTPLINGFSLELGADAVFAGIICGSMSVVSLFLRPIAGNLSDRFSKFRLSTIGGALIFIGVMGYCISSEPWMLLVFRLINGTGFVLATVCMTTWLAFLVPREHIGEAMSFYGLMNALSMAVAPAVGINLYHIIGYRFSLALGAAAAILMLIMTQNVKDHAYAKDGNAQAGAGTEGAQDAGAEALSVHKKGILDTIVHIKVFQKDALPITIFMICFSIPYFATQADLVEYVIAGHLAVSAGLFFVIYAVALLALRLVLKSYFDTVCFGVWFWLSAGSMALFLIVMAYMDNDFLMAIAAVLLSIGYGVIYSANQSTAMMLAPLNEQGLASSTFYIGLDIGMALAPMIGGVLASYVPHIFFYPVMLVLLPISIVEYELRKHKLNNAIHTRSR